MRLPELFRPIPDAELPHLDAYKKRSVRVLSSILLGIACIAFVHEAKREIALPERLVLALAINVVLTLIVVRFSRPTSSKADLAVVATSLAFLHNITSIAWTSPTPHNDVINALALTPIILACFVPARPTYSLLLGAATMGAALMSAKLGVRPHEPMDAFLFSVFLNTVIGAFAVQVQRQLWHKLEQARAQLAASDRMTVLGRLSAGIAHEMKTPLAAAMNGLESTRALAAELAESIDHPDVESADLLEIAREITATVDGATSATKRAARFITAIRAQTLAVSSVDSAPFAVASAVTNAITLVEHVRRNAGVVVDTSAVTADLNVVSDESKLSQIVTTLVVNALDACASGKGTFVRVSAKLIANDRILLVVEDDGPGVPETHRDRIFDALFTTKRDADGTGLGLAISRDIAEGALGGRLVLASSERGARFELEFPQQNGKHTSQIPVWSPAKAA